MPPIFLLLFISDPTGYMLSFLLRLPVHYYEFITVIFVEWGMAVSIVLMWSLALLRAIYLVATVTDPGRSVRRPQEECPELYK